MPIVLNIVLHEKKEEETRMLFENVLKYESFDEMALNFNSEKEKLELFRLMHYIEPLFLLKILRLNRIIKF